MGREEIEEILSGEPMKWFDSKKIREITGLSKASITKGLFRIRKHDGIQFKPASLPGVSCNRMVYRYNPKLINML